jgi:4-hydroxybenzoate polyprenyltransferase
VDKKLKPVAELSSLLRACHAGPTLLVVTISFILATSQFSVLASLEVASAILAGQFVVGWSNDLIDFDLDAQAARSKKPLVSGEISPDLLKRSILIAMIAALVLSLIGPLGIIGTAIHSLGLLSATGYNLKLKRTILSPLPYIISFGAMPWAISKANGTNPPLWMYSGFALFSTAFHFLNVLKDLQWDISQGILGAPQRLGRIGSIAVAAILFILGLLVIVAGN